MALRASIRIHLLRLVLAVAVPLVALQAWNLYSAAQAEARLARERVFHLAQVTASDTGRFLAQALDVLNGLAARPAVSALDPARCDPVLSDFRSLTPRFANVVTLALDGQVVCSAQSNPRAARANPDNFLKRMRGVGELTVGKAAPGAITGKWVVPVGRPLLDALGRVAGAVVLPVDLVNFPVLPSIAGLPANSVVGLMASDGQVLARSLEPEKYVGTMAGAGRTALREKSGTAEVTGIDGVVRIQGFAPVPGTDWIAVASLPASEIYAGFHTRRASSALITIATVFFVLLLALRQSRQIREPIDALAETAAEVRAGNLAARSPVVGSAEIAEVASQFNRMLDALFKSQSERERLAQIVEQTSDIVATARTDGQIVYLNPAARQAARIGKDEDATRYRNEQFYPPEVWAFVQQVARPAAVKNGTWSGEVRFRGPDGGEIEASMVVIAHREADGSAEFFTGVSRDVTTRNRAEASLRESQEKLQLFVEFAPSAIAMFDRDMRYIAFSRRWIADYRLADRDLAGRSHYEIFPDLPERWKGVHRRCLAGATERAEEDLFPRADGSTDWVRWEVRPWHDAKGGIGGLIIFTEVITGRKRAEEAINEGERRLSTLIANLPGTAYRCRNDADFTTEFISDGVAALTGYPAEDFRQHRREIGQLIHPDDRAQVRSSIEAALKIRQPFELTYRLVSSTGAEIWVWEKGRGVFDSGGQLQALEGFAIDITERKRIDSILRASEERMAGAIASAMDAIITINEEHEILIFNPAAETMFGRAAADMIGKRLDVLLPERYRAAHGMHVAEFSRTGITNRAMGKLGRIVGLRADGEEFPIEASISQIGASPHKLYTVILRDVSERQRAEESLRESLARQRELLRRLQATEEAERRRINRELHDRIGQNLSMLILNLDLLRHQAPQEALRSVAPRLDSAQDQLLATTREVRDLMADLHPPALDDFGLLAALRTYGDTLSARAGVPVAVSGVEASPRLPPAVEMGLFRVAEGALANAIKHAHATRIEVTLAAAERVTLTIADDGKGFDHVARSGTPSWGLTIMRERAEAVGAVLRVESSPGAGTRVIVDVAREAA